MRTNIAFSALVIVCAVTMWSCGGGSLPLSPSVLSPAEATGGAGRTLRPMDYDPMPDPSTPMPDPGTPAPDPNAPAPAPTPMAVIINIIGTVGSNAFMPNPTTANMGDQIVFANTDTRVHHIVLDDGTDLGEVQPGQSSAPVALATPTAMFHCTIHPTMVGAINGDIVPPYVPPPDDYYGYY